VPVVHIRSLAPAGGDAEADAALASVARAVASAIGAEPAGTWCTFTAVDRMTLGERSVSDAGRIVYLDLWLRSRGAEIDRAALVAAARAASTGFGVPIEDVWATLRLVEPGRVMAGGQLVDG
jgi:hypothetical protein